MNRSFPFTRLRRVRMKNFSRNLTQESSISQNDFIWPVFIIDGKNQKQEIQKMPLVFIFQF